MAGHSTWRVTGSRITGAVPEEVRAGQSRPPDLAYTGQMRSSGQFRHAASDSNAAPHNHPTRLTVTAHCGQVGAPDLGCP